MAWSPDRTWTPPSLCSLEEALLAAGLSAGAASGVASAAPVLGTLATIGGTAASFAGTQQAAEASRQQAQSQAAALQAKAAADRVQANQEAAFAQRQALNEQRRTELVLSRSRALAAAGGGFATDPSTLNLESNIAGQGEYNALSQLAAGQTREAALKYQSDLDLFQAGRYRQAGDIAGTTGLYTGAGTIFSGLGTLASNTERRRALSLYGAGFGPGTGGLY